MTADPAAPECTCIGLSERSQVSPGPWHLAECPLNNDPAPVRPPRPPCSNHAPHEPHLLYRNPDQTCPGAPAPAAPAVDSLRIKSGEGAITLATCHDGSIEAEAHGRVILDREAITRLTGWLTRVTPRADTAPVPALCICGDRVDMHPLTRPSGTPPSCPRDRDQAAAFRTPAPVSDGDALAELFKAHDFSRVECSDHDGQCCPAGCHDLNVSQYVHYATQAAKDRAEAVLAEAEWLETAHTNSVGKGYSSEYRSGFKAAAGWVRLHGDASPASPAPVDVAGLCHWVQNWARVQSTQSHDDFHFGYTCPYAVVAAVLAGKPDPRVGDDAPLKPCRVFDEPCGSDTCLRLCVTSPRSENAS
jgi:hypothetical protein